MNEKPHIIVTGSNGQLGNELADIAGNYPQFTFVFTNRDTLSLDNPEQLQALFKETKPAYFINCAAYTAVDKAENDKDTALAINATAIGNIAALCKQYNTKLVHISTDYVFDGNGTEPYTEDQPTDPVNYYGYSKEQGEKLAIENNEATIIIRTSWVYSTYGNNFVKTMIRLMSQRPEISVVGDQVGSPTYAADLAQAIMDIITGSAGFVTGIYHYSNSGVISWYDFAVAIKEGKQLNSHINNIPTSGYPTPAKRPAYSAMSKDKIANTFNLTIKDWKESLHICLSKM